MRYFLPALWAFLLLLTPSAGIAKETPSILLFTNVNVWDGTSESLRSNMHVLVEGNLISTISDEPLAVIQSTNMKVIDGGGRTLMPGLIDSHSHFNVNAANLAGLEGMRWDEIGARAASQAQEWLADGFTTVRSMGGTGNGLKRTIDAGLLDGPRIYPSASYVSQTSGHGDIVLGSQNNDPSASNLVRLGIAQLADGPDAVRAAGREARLPYTTTA